MYAAGSTYVPGTSIEFSRFSRLRYCQSQRRICRPSRRSISSPSLQCFQTSLFSLGSIAAHKARFARTTLGGPAARCRYYSDDSRAHESSISYDAPVRGPSLELARTPQALSSIPRPSQPLQEPQESCQPPSANRAILLHGKLNATTPPPATVRPALPDEVTAHLCENVVYQARHLKHSRVPAP